MYKTVVRSTLAVGVSLAASLALVSCATSTNTDKDNPTSPSTAVSSNQDEDIKQASAQAVEKLYDTTLNPRKLDELSSLSSKEASLLEKTGNHHDFDSLSPREKNEAINIANRVYEIENNFYGFNGLSLKEKEDLVITITVIHNNFKYVGIKELSAKVDPSLVEEQGETQVYVPAKAIDLKLNGKEFESSDFVVLIKGDTFLIDPQSVIKEYRKSVEMIDEYHNSSTTSSKQEKTTSTGLPAGGGSTDSSPNTNDNPPVKDDEEPDSLSRSDSLPDIINKHGDIGELMDNSLKELGYSIQELQSEDPPQQ